MLRRLMGQFTRRQCAALGVLALTQAAALTAGVLGYEPAAWAGLMVGLLAVAALTFIVGNRLAGVDRDLRRDRAERESAAAPDPEPDELRSEILLRRVLAAVEHERHLNARRFAELAGAEPVEAEPR